MIAAVALNDSAGCSAADDVARLYRAEYPALVRMASLVLGDRDGAEEVVQEAFVKLQVGWGRVRDIDKAPAWLRSAVLNGARSQLRRRRVRRRLDRPAPLTSPSAEGDAIAGDEHRRVMVALRRLPDRQREALVLKFYLDLSEAETAAAMGVSAGSVKTHVHRGLAALQTTLGREEDR